MGFDVSSFPEIPLKKLELRPPTLAKLKPLGPQSARQLYALPLARLIALGLGKKELAELAEAAADLGATWHTQAELDRALKGAGADAGAKAAAPPAKPRKKADKIALPKGPDGGSDDELAGPADAPIGLTEAEVDAFASFVDASGMHFQSPPPSPRHLALFRHLGVIRDHSIGGPERWYLIAVADVSQLPASRYAATNTFLAHLANLLSDALQRADIIKPGHSRYGCAAVYALTAKTRARAEKVAAAFSRRPIFAQPLGPLTLFGAAGLIAANLYDDALALTPALLKEGSEPSLDLTARAWLGAERAGDGLVSLRPRLSKPEELKSIPLLKNGALLAARGLAPDLAIALLARAFKLDANPQLRAWAVDEPTFAPLRPSSKFRALFKGLPAFEARLR